MDRISLEEFRRCILCFILILSVSMDTCAFIGRGFLEFPRVLVLKQPCREIILGSFQCLSLYKLAVRDEEMFSIYYAKIFL